MISSISDIEKYIQKTANEFNFTHTLGSFINNIEFSKGFTDFVNGVENGDSFVFHSLSAIGDDISEVLYQNILNYVDNVSNVDLCKVKSLKSMMKLYGIQYSVFDNLNNIPNEILNLIDIFSIGKNHFLNNKFKTELKQDMVDENVIDDSQNTIDEDRFQTYVKEKFTNVLSGFVNLSYLDEYYTRIVDTAFFKNEYEGIKNDRLLSTKLVLNVDRYFDVEGVVDNIENGIDTLSNYTGGKLELIKNEIAYRNDYPVIDGEIPVDYPETRTSYYRKRKVMEYVNFIENIYFYDSLISEPDDIENVLRTYSIDQNYFEIKKRDDASKVLFYNNNIATIDYDIIDHVAQSLTNITLYITKLREKIKLQMRKNYMKGSFNLLSFIINEYLIEYTNASNVTDEKIKNKLQNHDIRDIDIIEYCDTTEYFNIKTNNSLNHISVNDRYWLSSDTSNSQALDYAFDQKAIENFYLKTMQMGDVISDRQSLNDFLSTIYSLGANDSYIDDNGIFQCQLKNGVYTHDLLPIIENLSANWDGFIEYQNIIPEDNFKYLEGQLSDQIEDVLDKIYTQLSAIHLSGVSSIYDDNIDTINTLDTEYNIISSDFKILLADVSYQIYLSNSVNRFCYKDNSIDNIPLYDWKKDYSEMFFFDSELSSYKNNDDIIWQDQLYNKYLYEKINKLDQFVKTGYINNYPLIQSVTYISSEYVNLSNELNEHIIKKIESDFAFTPLGSDTLSEELEYTQKFLETKKAEIIQNMKDLIKQWQEQSQNLLNSYNELNNTYQVTVANYKSATGNTEWGNGIAQNYYFADCGQTFNTGLYTYNEKLLEDNPEKYSEPPCEHYIQFDKKQYGKQSPKYGEGNLIYDKFTGYYYLSDRVYYEVNESVKLGKFHKISGGNENIDCNVSEMESLAEKILKLQEWSKQITFGECVIRNFYETNDEGELTNKLAYQDCYEFNVKRTFMDVGVDSAVEHIISSLTNIKAQLDSIVRQLDENEIDVSSLNVNYGIGDLDNGLSNCYDLLNQIMALIELVSGLTYEQMNNTRLNIITNLIPELQIIQNRHNELKNIWDELPRDKEQVSFLADYVWKSTLNIPNIKSLEIYRVNTQRTHEKNINKSIENLYDKYDTLIDHYIEIANNVSQQMTITTYEPMIDGYFEDFKPHMMRAIDFEIQARINAAIEKINMEKEKIHKYMYFNENAIYPEITLKYSLSDTTSLSNCVMGRLDDINFFRFQEYLDKYDFFLTYTGNSDSFDPSVNHKNIVHPSYQIHPYLDKFIEIGKIDDIILQSYENEAIEQLYSNNIHNYISNILGEFGQAINIWLYNIRDYTGYRSKYEMSKHIIDTNYSVAKFSPVIDYDGGFFPDAIKMLFDGTNQYDIYVESVRRGTLYNDDGSATFYGKFYSHLEITQEERNYIANQLEYYKHDIENIITTYENKHQVFDIFKYTTDQFNNSYILYKKYDESLFQDGKEPSYLEKRNTPGDIWIKKENHPIAFPAFSGNFPNVNIKHMYTNDLMSGFNSKFNTTKNIVYDIELDNSKQMMGIIFKHKDDVVFDSAKVLFSKIIVDQNLDEREKYQTIKFVQTGKDYQGVVTHYYNLFSVENLNEEEENDFKLLGLSQSNDNQLDILCINKYNIGTEFEIYIKSVIKDYTISEINTFKYSQKIKFCDSDQEISNLYLRFDVDPESNVAFSFNKKKNEYTFTTIGQYIGNNLPVRSVHKSVCSDYLEESEYNINNVEYTSLDRFDKFIITLKYTPKGKNIFVSNLNGDSSYIPLYSGEKGLLKKTQNTENYNVIELLGYSKSLDEEIQQVNPTYNPYFDVNDIKKNYLFGRVYESYDESDYDTLFHTKNYGIEYNYAVKEYIWQLGSIETQIDKVENISHLRIFFFNVNCLGKHPYYVGNLSMIADKWVDCFYTKHITDDSEVELTNENGIKIQGIYNYYNNKRSFKDTNVLNNIDNIQIKYDTREKEIYVKFIRKDINTDTFIEDEILNVVVCNPNDIRMFQDFHLLDSFGIVRQT